MQKVFMVVLVVCLIGCSDSTDPLSGEDSELFNPG